MYATTFETFALSRPPPTGTWREAFQIKRRYDRRWLQNKVASSRRLVGHEGAVMCIASLGGAYMASGGSDGSLRLWDVTASDDGGGGDASSSCAVARLESAHDGGVLCLAAGSDSATSAFAQTNSAFGSGGGSASPVNSDTRLCSGGIDRIVKYWDVDTGIALRSLSGHSEPVTHLTGVTNRFLVSGGGEQVRLWDDAACVQHFSNGARLVAVRAINDQCVLTASDDNVLRVWDSVGARTLRSWRVDAVGALLDVLPDIDLQRAMLVGHAGDVLTLSKYGVTALSAPPPSVRVSAAARDPTRLVLASGTRGAVHVRFFVSAGDMTAQNFASVHGQPIVGAEPEASSAPALGTTLDIAFTDALLATAHESGVVRVLNFDK